MATSLAPRSTALFALLGLSAMACTPSPNESTPTTGAHAPDPTVICQHVRTLAASDNGDEQVLDQLQRECVQALDSLESRYVMFATCVEAATSSAAVVECEAALAKPPSLIAAASPTIQVGGCVITSSPC
jgi:hypothetical protein